MAFQKISDFELDLKLTPTNNKFTQTHNNSPQLHGSEEIF
jgi:hypothetical protein